MNTKYSDYKYREYRTTFDPHGLGSYVTSQGRKDVAGRKHAPAESRVARVHPIHSSSSSTGLAGKIGTSRECGFAHPLNVSRLRYFGAQARPLSNRRSRINIARGGEPGESRPEDIFPKSLPIILLPYSQNFHLLFLQIFRLFPILPSIILYIFSKFLRSLPHKVNYFVTLAHSIKEA